MITRSQSKKRPTRIQKARAKRLKQKNLCRACRAIDLDLILNRKHGTRRGIKVRDMGPLDQWAVDSCVLCRLLATTFDKEARENRAERYLTSFSSNQVVSGGWPSVHTNMLSIDQFVSHDLATANGIRTSNALPYELPLKYLVPQPRGVEIVRKVGRRASFKLPQEWLRFCRQHHTLACNVSTSAAVSSISSFKLIDCETRAIVPVSDQPYATLSYVWGSGSAPIFSDVVPPNQPKTIEDAIQVTKTLGLKYLWIDRFCINQQIAQEIEDQVPKMDVIYNNSELTIIVAAGEDPNYGIPGARERTPVQPHGKVGDYYLVSTMDDPVLNILRSKWATRAWTYQEGILARRRLIFTDDQLYFECSGMRCAEALNTNLKSLHTQNQQRFKAKFCHGSNICLFPREIGLKGWEIVDRIEEYSRKSLTKGSDILNGLQGILKAYERSTQGIKNCFGVPVVPRAPRQTHMQWTPKTGFCIGLCWDVAEGSSRREGFPSWSWSGWHGKIEWVFNELIWPDERGNTDMAIWIQLQDDSFLAWERYYHAYDVNDCRITSTLRMATWVIPLQFSTQRERFMFQLKTVDGETLFWRFKLKSHSYPTSETTKWMAVPLAHDKFGAPIVLVVFETEQGRYQRGGIGEITFNNLESTYGRLGLWAGNTKPPDLKKEYSKFDLA
ncbi:heterokaryon incompatibility protein-domain-containing protein [Xylaria digitata]|nr:heterokaryon incompatibility protein-domain-containing protein [Xylaria digitata]